jgi:hypothetical protein
VTAGRVVVGSVRGRRVGSVVVVISAVVVVEK